MAKCFDNKIGCYSLFCQCWDLLVVSQDVNQMQSWQCGCLLSLFPNQLLVDYTNIGGFQQYWWVSTILVFFQYWCYKANKILQNSAILSVQCFWPNITTILQRLLYTLVWLILVKYLVKGRIHWYQSRTFFFFIFTKHWFVSYICIIAVQSAFI